MDEKQKIDTAIFRYSVIHDFVGGITLEYGQKQKLLQEKCAQKWSIPFSEKSSISPSTILRWIQLYKDSGQKLESLYPKDRNDRGKLRTLTEEICLVLKRTRKKFFNCSHMIFCVQENAKELFNIIGFSKQRFKNIVNF